VATVSQCLHAVLVLQGALQRAEEQAAALQQLQAQQGAGGGSGLRSHGAPLRRASQAVCSEESLQALCCTALPAGGSWEEALLACCSRLAYPLATIMCCSALAPWESSFMTRPTGGSASFLDASELRACPLGAFPPSAACWPAFGPSSQASAAGLLRLLWERLPLARTGLAHVLAVTALATAARLQPVTVSVSSSASSSSSSSSGSGSSRSSSAPLSFTVEVTEDVLAARYAGVVLERLQQGLPELQPQPSAGSGSGSGSGRAQQQQQRQLHPLVASVEGRLRGALLRRSDGIVLGSLDVELVEQ
jgi:hypothetical protein